jgi:DNA repair exonuclease SbcCD ATPase subunit
VIQKLIFNRVFARNFRSINNHGLEVILNASPTTLVCSVDNGAGKSTMTVHAIFYCLFDLAYDTQNKKTSLVNSRSNKDCYVELEFQTKGKTYLVKRGMKPTLFEIYEDGVLIESEAAKKDYQAYLLAIIGMDSKVFQNTIVLGKDRFVPFATMSASDRRAYVERMLDLTVFARMNEITKDEVKTYSFTKSDLEYKLQVSTSNKEKYEGIIAVIQDGMNRRFTENTNKIKDLHSQIGEIKDIYEKLDDVRLQAYSELDPIVVIDKELREYNNIIVKLGSKIDDINSLVSRFEKLDTCPTCNQTVSEEHKDACTGSHKLELVQYTDAFGKANSIYTDLSNKLVEGNKKVAAYEEIVKKREQLAFMQKGLQTQLDALALEVCPTDESEKLNENKELLNKVIEDYTNQQEQLAIINAALFYRQGLLLMLKDDGVKAKIVSQYLPFLNAKINQYLEKMNLSTTIILNDEFEVEMMAPDRKGQTLGSLSSGQLRRIDLAVLFAWRAVAKMRASCDVNLLVLDEVLESLSEQGVADFMGFYEEEFSNEELNLFVVSQREAEFSEHFESVIKYQMKDSFTILVT